MTPLTGKYMNLELWACVGVHGCVYMFLFSLDEKVQKCDIFLL